MHALRPIAPRRCTALAVALVLASATAGAQPLPAKRTLALPAPGCAGVAATLPAGVRRDNAEARRLAGQAREAALVGDRAAARDAYRRAAALNPTDEQLAYALARADEELGDARAAVADYCRYLALSPQGAQADDAQQRILRLSPAGAADAPRRAQDRFRAGLAALNAGRFADAADAFDAALRDAPGAPELLYDRAIARERLGRRAEAVRDLEAYLASAQAADDRPAVLRALAGLRRPTYVASTALTRGLIAPGMGQFYTGRPGLGVAALGISAAALGAVFYQRDVVREGRFVDPFGQPYTQPITETQRPYALAGAAVGVSVWALAALEARRYAGASSAARPAARRLDVAPLATPRGGSGLQLRATF